MATKKIDGLALLQAQPPFDDYFATVLDLRGPWTQEMLDASDDILPPCAGLWVWEGSCEVEAGDDDPDDIAYRFDGAWRPIDGNEVLLIVAERRPLTGDPFPDLEHLVQVCGSSGT